MSRVLGLVRDMLIARFIGTGVVADAFLTAFRFPNMFRRIFGEGAYNSAFVPLFGKKVTTEGRLAAVRFSNTSFSTLAAVLSVLTLLAIPLMSVIMLVIVPGFLPKVEESLTAEAVEFSVELKGAREVYFVGKAELSELVFVEYGERSTGQKLAALVGAADEAEGPRHRAVDVLADGVRDRVYSEDGPKLEELAKRYHDGKKWIFSKEELPRLGIPLPRGHNFAYVKGKASGAGDFEVYRNHPDAYSLTVTLSKITFVYLMCMALVAHLSGVLTTLKRFAIPAFAPVLLNIVFIAGLLIWVRGSEHPGRVLAWCVAVAGFLQLALLWWACRKEGLPIGLAKPKLTPEIKRLIWLMGPGVLAAGIQQVNLLVGGVIASFQQGAISYLYYSDRVYQLPLGMIGIAFGMVLLPEITRLVKSKQEAEASATMERALELAMIVTVPAALALIVIPEEIISVLFQRGDFSAEDSRQCGRALSAFALGLPGYVLIKVLQPGFFAREDTKSPMVMAGITVAVNIVVSLLLFPLFGHVGLAFATSVAAWVNVWLLWRGLNGMVSPDRAGWRRLLMMFISALVMAVVLGTAKIAVEGWGDEFWQRLVALALLVGLGMSTYALCALKLRATSVEELKAGFSR